jgi:hypothetical protein
VSDEFPPGQPATEPPVTGRRPFPDWGLIPPEDREDWGLYLGTVPPNLMNALIVYRYRRRIPGDFLQAVLRNDWIQAVKRADGHSLAAMLPLADLLLTCFPPAAFGSPEKVRRWAAGEDAAGILT